MEWRDGYTSYMATVNIKDLPRWLADWREINVRDPKEKSFVFKEIFKSLVKDPDMFIFKNKGMTIIAQETKFDNKTQEITITFDDPNMNGLLDWGHTYEAIRDYLSTFAADNSAMDAHVRIEIITGISDKSDIIDIVEARNTHAQVKPQGIENLRGTFDGIKKLFNGTVYGDRIHYAEFELDEDGYEKDIDIKNILSCLICFDTNTFNEEKHPIISYNGKRATLRHFAENKQQISKYIPLLPKILELYETIYKELPWYYPWYFGSLDGVTKITGDSRREPIELEYTQDQSEWVIPNGYVMPILASMRTLIDITPRGSAMFREDPIAAFRKNWRALANRVGEAAKSFNNANRTGKTIMVWSSCFDVMEKYAIKHM